MSNNPFRRDKKPYKTVSVGEWWFAWYLDRRNITGSYMTVKSTSSLLELKIKANSEVFGYLLAAAQQEKTEQLHGWITLVAIPALGMTQDQQLTDDVQDAVKRRMERKDEQSKAAASEVSEDNEAAAQAQMEDIAEYADADDERREEIRREDAEVLKTIINDNKR